MQVKALVALIALHPLGLSLSASANFLLDGAPPQLSKSDQKHEADLKSDIELGKQYSAEVEKEGKLSKDAEGIARIERIGSELAAVANAHQVLVSWGDTRLNPLPYTFRLLEGKDVNAFSLPGGFIYVYEGLLKYCESDDELAGVLAHEISHASFRHLAVLRREQSKLDSITLPLILIAIITGGSTATGLASTGSLVSQAIGSGWSVKAEQSADYGGFQYMLKTRYNPVAMLTFMERLAYDDRNRPVVDWGIYRTHPPSRERAEALRDRLRFARITIKRSEVSTTLRGLATKIDDRSYRLSFAGQDIHTFSGLDAEERSQAAAKSFSAFMDTVPQLADVRADASAVLGRSTPLFVVSDDDAIALGKSAIQVARDAAQAIKSATFDLGYRVWRAF